jgi:hypothetical protein
MCRPSLPSSVISSISSSKQRQDALKTEEESKCRKLSLDSRELKIRKLNERADAIIRKALQDSDKDGVPLYISQAQKRMTVVSAGFPVFQRRSAVMVYIYWTLGCLLLVGGVVQLPPLVSLFSVLVVFLGYDIYSGVLHVVFDHPQNIHLPFVGQPCLEFQWHHLIPDDLVRKDFIDVCGDLNVVVGIVSAINFIFLVDMTNPLTLICGGTKFFMAYFGQYSHRSAHTHGPQLGVVAQRLQSAGIMISRQDHKAHHKAPFDTDFCLIGVCNPIIDAMRRVTVNRTVWLATFLVWSVFDVAALILMIEKLSQKVGAL